MKLKDILMERPRNERIKFFKGLNDKNAEISSLELFFVSDDLVYVTVGDCSRKCAVDFEGKTNNEDGYDYFFKITAGSKKYDVFAEFNGNKIVFTGDGKTTKGKRFGTNRIIRTVTISPVAAKDIRISGSIAWDDGES